MDNVQITQVDGEPPIFREMQPVPVTLESCILNNEENFSYSQGEHTSTFHDNHDDGELSAEEINSMIMINEGPDALSSVQEQLESSRASTSIRNSSDIKKILTSDLPKSGRFLSTKSLQKLSGAKNIIRKNSKYAHEDETDDDTVAPKFKKMLSKQNKTVENLNKSNKNKGDCKNIKKNVRVEKLRVKTLKRKNTLGKLPGKKKSLKTLKKCTTNKCKDLSLATKVLKKKVLKSNTDVEMEEMIPEVEETEFEAKKPTGKITESVKKKSKTENTPKLLISRSGRIRKIRDVSDFVLSKNKEGKILNPEVDPASLVISIKEESENKTEIIKDPVPNEANSKTEGGKENKSKGDLLQSALSESIEGWFDISSDIEKKGKRAKGKVKIIPKDFDDCFEETKNVQEEKNCETVVSENSQKINSDFFKSEHLQDEEKEVKKANNIDEMKINEDDTQNSQDVNKTSMDIVESENIKSDIEEPVLNAEQNKDDNDKKLAALNGKKVKSSNRQLMGYKKKRRKTRNVCVTSYVKNYGERIDFNVKIEPEEIESKKQKNVDEEIDTKKQKNVAKIKKQKNVTDRIENKEQENVTEETENIEKENITGETENIEKENITGETENNEHGNVTEEIENKKTKYISERIKSKRKKNITEGIENKEQENVTDETENMEKENVTGETKNNEHGNVTIDIESKNKENIKGEIGKQTKNTSERIKSKRKKNITGGIENKIKENDPEEIENKEHVTDETDNMEKDKVTEETDNNEQENVREKAENKEQESVIEETENNEHGNVTEEIENKNKKNVKEEIENKKKKNISERIKSKKKKNDSEETENKEQEKVTDENENMEKNKVTEETESNEQENITGETENNNKKNEAEKIECKKQNVTKKITRKRQKSVLEETKSVEDGISKDFEKRENLELTLPDFDKSSKLLSKRQGISRIKRSRSAENLSVSYKSKLESSQKGAEMDSLTSPENQFHAVVKDCTVVLNEEAAENFIKENKIELENEDQDKEQKTDTGKDFKESERKESDVSEEQTEKKIERKREAKPEDDKVQKNKKLNIQKKKRSTAVFTKVFGTKNKRKQMWALARKEKLSSKKRNWPLREQTTEDSKNSESVNENKNVSSNTPENKENDKAVEGPNKKQEVNESFSTSSALSIPLKKRPRRTKTNEALDEIGKENKEETKSPEKHDFERRKSHREIKLTPKIVDMIAISFSNKRYRKSSSCKEESTVVKEEPESTNSAQKSGGGSEAKSRLTEQPPEVVPSVENYLQSKMDANASNFESSWEPGDLVWARFAGNPFWPALILRDPFCNDEYSRIKYLGRLPRPFVHVQFLADYGRRAWGPELYIMTFNGLEEFEKLKSSLPEVNAYTQRKDLVYQQAFFTPKKLEKNWAEAVKEADTLINKSKDERITYMKIKYPLVKYAASVANGRLVPNERAKCGDSKSLQGRTRKRKKLSSSSTPGAWPTPESKDTFECVNTSDMDEGVKKSEKESPKITLKLVRSPRKGSKRKSKSIDETEGKKVKKKFRKEMLDDDYAPSDTGSNGEKGSDTVANRQKKYFLFKGARAEKVCQICVEILENEKTLKCKGPCQGLFHKSCAEKMSADLPPLEGGLKKGIKYRRRRKLFANGDSDNSTDAQSKDTDEKDWICNDCLRGENPCFVCNSRSGNRQRCCVAYCGKFYHQKCLKLYPQTIYNQGAPIRKSQSLQQSKTTETESPHYQILSCPLHVCHTCASDNPADFNMKYLCEKLVKCIKCPSAYHGGNFCVPAGTTILNTSQIICAKHGDPGKKSHVNISWCFICNMGGSLICCEWCPSSFHLDCLNLKPPDGPYICEECESGRFPLYGEVVWVKLGRYRWWPARILFPQEILPNIMALPHKPWEFAVRFYGSNDHYWLNRGRVFLYQEGDSEQKFKGQSHVDKIYQRAVQEATKDYFSIQEERKSRLTGTNTSGVMKPPPYVKIKTNKAVGKVQLGNLSQSEPQTCDCDPNSEAPCCPGSDCLNRMLLVECNPNYCNAGSRCGNQSFEKREYPPLEPYRTETRGWGLRSSIDIPKGAFVIEYVGEVIDDEEFKRRMKRKQETKDSNYYFLTIDKDRMIDAGPKGNLARFMNHSCSPNCETQKWTVNGDTRVGLFAIRDIPAGTELTFNYNLDCIGNEKKPCHCEEENCSGFIGVKAKNDKSESLKNKAVKRLEKESDDECFVCNDGGELMVCDVPNCPKVYHIECVNLTEWPNELWFCPRHRCTLCNRTTKRCCKLCPTAYCFAHLDNNMFPDNQGGLLCSKHSTCAVKPAQILRKASYVNRNTPIIEYEKPFAEKYRPPPQKERTTPEEKKEEILMEPNLTDNTPIVVENPLLSSATSSGLKDGVSVQVLYVDEEGQIVSVDGSDTPNAEETTTSVRESEEMPKPVKRRKRTNIPRKKLNPPMITEEVENKQKSPTQGGINFESLMIKSVEDKILDSKLNMDNIYNIIGGGGGGEGERETGQSDSAERCIRDDSNDLKSETASKKEEAEVDRSRRSKYFKIITPEKFIKVSESDSNQKKVTDFNYIEFMHPLRSARSKTKTDENTRK